MKPWLYTIVRNRALNAKRDNRSHEPIDETLTGSPQPDEILLGRDELARVVTAVNALPRAQREALVRSAVDGHTHEQIASTLETSPGAVRQLIYRGRATVRFGLGVLIPLPIMGMIAGGSSGTATAAAAGTIGAAGAAGAVGAGGGSIALTGATLAAISAVAIGGAVAIERSGGDEPTKAATAGQSRDSQSDASPGDGGASGGSDATGDGGGSSSAGDDLGGDESRGSSGDDLSGNGDDGDGRDLRESSGPGRAETRSGEDHSGGSAGGGESSAEDSSGSGSGPSDSGSGSGDSGTGSVDPEPVEEPRDDSSGSGSDDSSGSGSGDLSGSGSGDADSVDD